MCDPGGICYLTNSLRRQHLVIKIPMITSRKNCCDKVPQLLDQHSGRNDAEAMSSERGDSVAQDFEERQWKSM